MNLFRYTFVALFIVGLTFIADSSAAPLKALIIDGQNNHDWKATTPVLKYMLEDCGRFEVDVATSPPQDSSLKNFRPEFSKYDVVVSNYNGNLWSKETQTDFENYIKNGGGLVSYHAADNAFPEWLEFNKMIALGGWGGRNEKSGPMVRVRDGKIVLDHSPGRGGAHGPRRDYPVVMHDLKHPISKGLPKVWLHAKDELYAKMRGPANIEDLLGYGKSKLTNENEPLLFTIEYGKGRIFHTALGHDVYAMRCIGFAFTLQRGTEWAATGKVTLNKIPENFPTEDRVSLWLEPVNIDEIANYTYGQSRTTLAAVEANIRIATPKQLREIEAQMLSVLNAEGATFDGCAFVCQMLRRIGTVKSVKTLGKFLQDDRLNDPARLALQGIQSPKVDALFKKSLNSLTGDKLIGVIGSIAERRNPKAAKSLAKFLKSDDPYLQQVTTRALGRIGGKAALKILSDFVASDDLEPYKLDALLLCADSLAQTKSAALSKNVYTQLSSPEYPAQVRVAAYGGLINIDSDSSLPLVISLLKENEPKLQQAACGPFLKMLPGEDASKSLAQELKQLPEESQVVVLNALARRGHGNVIAEVLDAAKSSNASVQIAAVQTLGAIGNARVAAPLITFALKGGQLGQAAQNSLARLKGDRVNGALIAFLGDSNEAKRLSAINALADRNARDAFSSIVKLTGDKSPGIRQAAYNALMTLGGANDVPTVLQLIQGKDDEGDIRGLEEVAKSLSSQLADKSAATDKIASLFADSSPKVKQSYIRLLTEYSGPEAFNLVSNSLQDKNRSVQNAALYALGSWKDNTPIELLLSRMSQFKEEEQRGLAFKAVIHSLGLTPPDSPWFGKAKAKAKTANEKKMMIGALAKTVDMNSLTQIESYLSDKEVKAEAISACEALINKLSASELDRSDWKLSASHNNGAVKNAIDGNEGSRWDTAATQVPGMWLQVDIGSQRSIQKIVLDSKNSGGDYPRGYQVLLSSDGISWSGPVVEGKGETPVVALDIPNRTARFIKIIQTGKVDGLYWSIHELYIEASMDSGLLNDAKAKLAAAKKK
ncbi:MAG: HEAT repeat domain-containing protein [Candidatus Hinthialibacter antarcticus]|nr:HEAT repeat domain-containing protein [Candidatus Hinthialibacter antarcticus]